MTKLFIKHIRKCRYCLPGFIAFCKERGLDYQSFSKNGIEINELRQQLKGEEHTLIERAIKQAEKEQK